MQSRNIPFTYTRYTEKYFKMLGSTSRNLFFKTLNHSKKRLSGRHANFLQYVFEISGKVIFFTTAIIIR